MPIIRRAAHRLKWLKELQRVMSSFRHTITYDEASTALHSQWDQSWKEHQKKQPTVLENVFPIAMWPLCTVSFRLLSRAVKQPIAEDPILDLERSAMAYAWARSNVPVWNDYPPKLGRWIKPLVKLELRRLKWTMAWQASCVYNYPPSLALGMLSQSSGQETPYLAGNDLFGSKISSQRHKAWLDCFGLYLKQKAHLRRNLSLLHRCDKGSHHTNPICINPGCDNHSELFVLIPQIWIRHLGSNKRFRPSLAKSHLSHIRSILQRNRATTQWYLIKQLNRAVIDWSRVFAVKKGQNQSAQMSSHLQTRLQQWGIRRHSGHNSRWAETKYWQLI